MEILEKKNFLLLITFIIMFLFTILTIKNSSTYFSSIILF